MAKKDEGVISDWFQNRYADIDAGLIELRVMDETGVIHREWCSTPQAIEKVVAKFPKNSVYYGLSPRSKKGKGKKPDIVCVPFLWADVDVNKRGWDMGKTVQAIHSLPVELRPTAMIHSGGGLHLYWQLQTPLTLNSGDPEWHEAVEMIETLNKRLAGLVGGDAVQDITRVLRVPGSLNPKRGVKKKVEVYYDYRWRKHTPLSLDAALRKAPVTLLEDTFVAMKDVPPPPGSKLTYEEAFFQALNVGNKAARRIKLDELEDRTRFGGTGFPYIGIDDFITRAVSMLHIDHENEDDIVCALVFERLERVMLRTDPSEWASWDKEAEREKIMTNLQRYKPKWALTKARLKAEAKALAKAKKNDAAGPNSKS